MQTRRGFLRSSLLLSTLPLAGSATATAIANRKTETSGKNRLLRIAHITDCHTASLRKARKNMDTVFLSINSMPDRPDLIINTGDTVMEANGQSKERVHSCWKAWNQACSSNDIPVFNCIGNHDVWTKPLFTQRHNDNSIQEGKSWAVEELMMPNRYYSFTKNGWKFIMLDSIGEQYEIDEEQFYWLKTELASTPAEMPVCIGTHVPILSAASLMYNIEHRKGRKHYPGKEMHSDVRKLKDLFYQHPNVKLCLSGHVHYVDSVEFLGVKYLCNGAVSGNWWRGSLDEFPPAYAIVDLYDDGSSRHEVVYY